MANPVHARYALLAAVLLAPAVACQFLVSSDVFQCTTDGDCASRGGQFATATCVSRVCVQPSADSGGGEASVDSGPDALFACANTPYPTEESLTHLVTYSRTFQNASGNQGLTEIGVRVCSLFDQTCLSPRDQGGATTIFPNAAGTVTVQVGYGFAGLLEVNNLDGGQQYVTPALIQIHPPLIQDASVGPNALMVSPATFAGVASLVFDAGAVASGLAHLFFRTHDCQDNSLSGISVDVDKQDTLGRTRRFYFNADNLPLADEVQTDPGGKGGFLNLPPGTATLTARFHDTTKFMGKVSVALRADYITYVIITPSAP